MKLSELKLILETPASAAHEADIAKKLKKKGFKIWAEPKGSDAGWPDVGASITLPSGKQVFLHIEAKMSKRDPMGSLRKWEYKGGKFAAIGDVTDNQLLILDVLNGSKDVKKRATKMLSLLKKHFSKDVKEIKSGSLSVIKEKDKRYKQTLKFVKLAKAEFGGSGNNFQLSSPAIKDKRIGTMIVDHYKNKFKKKAGGDNLMLFILGSEAYIIPHGKKLSKAVQKELYEVLGVETIPEIPAAFAGSLEVRVQVRHLSKKGAKPTSIDVMATLRGEGLNKVKGAKIT
jgi:hypothetical protein